MSLSLLVRTTVAYVAFLFFGKIIYYCLHILSILATATSFLKDLVVPLSKDKHYHFTRDENMYYMEVFLKVFSITFKRGGGGWQNPV